MKIFKITAALLFALSPAVQTFGLTVTVTPPQVSENQTAVNDAAKQLEADIMSRFGNVSGRPKKFAKANADSASYTSHVATQRGYTDYEHFAFTLGGMAGFQSPSLSFSDFDDFHNNLDDSMKDRGDVETGFSTQFAMQLGLKASFISDNLYLGAKFGMMKFKLSRKQEKDYKYSMFTFGLTGNYVLFNSMSTESGAVRWRGVNFGTGFIYQTSKMKYIASPEFAYASAQGSGDSYLYLQAEDLRLKYNIDSKNLTIPFELTTALRLLHRVNFTAGIGADFVVGKTEVTLGMEGGNIRTGGYNITVNEPGRLQVEGGSVSVNPSVIKPKIIGGIGIDISGVIIDVPFTLYYGNGLNVGITLGFIW